MRIRLLPLMLLACLPTARLAAQSTPQLEYAVKVVCGAPPIRTMETGRYSTVVNVHNPGTRGTVLRVKVARTDPDMRPGQVSHFLQVDLAPDQAVAIDCIDAARRIGNSLSSFLDGFLVIQSNTELDVVAVYTASSGARSGVATMHVERVPVRRLN
jgi:hypothetical protein